MPRARLFLTSTMWCTSKLATNFLFLKAWRRFLRSKCEFSYLRSLGHSDVNQTVQALAWEEPQIPPSFNMYLVINKRTGWSKSLCAPDFCIVIIRCTETFWSSCITILIFETSLAIIFVTVQLRIQVFGLHRCKLTYWTFSRIKADSPSNTLYNINYY